MSAMTLLNSGCQRAVEQSDTIEYRGEQFKLSKRYYSWDEYKDDPNNLATNELPRIENLMLTASIGSSFDTRSQFLRAVEELQFPGYGFSKYAETPQADGSE